MDDAGLDALAGAIRAQHACECTWVESVPLMLSVHSIAMRDPRYAKGPPDPRATAAVEQSFGRVPVWKGEVQVFALVGHPTAERCYAWSSRMMRVGDDREQAHQRLEMIQEIGAMEQTWITRFVRLANSLSPARPTGRRELYAILHSGRVDSPTEAVFSVFDEELRAAKDARKPFERAVDKALVQVVPYLARLFGNPKRK